MSNINDLVLEGIGNTAMGVGLGLVGRTAASIGGSALVNSIPAAASSALPFGNIITGIYGAGQQAYLNKLRDEYNQTAGIYRGGTGHSIWNGIKTVGSGLISSVPILGAFHNARLGASIANLQNKTNSMADARNYNSSVAVPPVQQVPQTVM